MTPRILPLQEFLAQCFVYCPLTGELTWRHRPRSHFQDDSKWKMWNTRFAGKAAGGLSKGRRMIAIYEVRYYTSRIIWKLVTGEEPPEVDHANEDGTDERLENLRPASRGQNGWNRSTWRTNGIPKGAYRKRGRWTSRIAANGILHNLGMFDTAEEAHAAYCEAARRLHGEFANFG